MERFHVWSEQPAGAQSESATAAKRKFTEELLKHSRKKATAAAASGSAAARAGSGSDDDEHGQEVLGLSQGSSDTDDDGSAIDDNDDGGGRKRNKRALQEEDSDDADADAGRNSARAKEFRTSAHAVAKSSPIVQRQAAQQEALALARTRLDPAAPTSASDITLTLASGDGAEQMTAEEAAEAAAERAAALARARYIASLPSLQRRLMGEVQAMQFKSGRSLRAYQEDGLQWLAFNYINRRNSILADEMGLGKTMQSVAFVKFLHDVVSVRGPTLVIAPLSTLPHWQREVAACTDLNAVVYQGDEESRRLIRELEFWYKDDAGRTIPELKRNRVTKFNVLITSYESFLADSAHLQQLRWTLLIVDEAQRLKNPHARFYQFCNKLKTGFRLLLTGTPIQNNMSELWALLHFLHPAGFGSEAAFLEKYGELTGGADVAQLNDLIRPFLLRRNKANVEKALKPLRETLVQVALTPLQKTYYKAVFDRNSAILHELARKSASDAVVPSMMNISMQLRKCCNHPFLLDGLEAAHAGEITAAVNRRNAAELAAAPDLEARAAIEARQKREFQVRNDVDIVPTYLCIVL